MKQKLITFAAVFFLSCSVANASNFYDRGDNIFIEMMLEMMEAMGFIDRDEMAYNQLYPNYIYPGPGGRRGTKSFSSPFPPPEGVPYFIEPHWIEGRWKSGDGMIMAVFHGRFEMYYPYQPENVRTGLIRIKDQWLAIREEQTGFTQQFEYAHSDGRLVLRDAYDNLMLFVRLIDWHAPLLY